jgi:hypothetical protein
MSEEPFIYSSFPLLYFIYFLPLQLKSDERDEMRESDEEIKCN